MTRVSLPFAAALALAGCSLTDPAQYPAEHVLDGRDEVQLVLRVGDSVRDVASTDGYVTGLTRVRVRALCPDDARCLLPGTADFVWQPASTTIRGLPDTLRWDGWRDDSLRVGRYVGRPVALTPWDSTAPPSAYRATFRFRRQG